MKGGDNSVILEEEYDPNYEPTSEEIREYAEFLGIDLQNPRHKQLLWIAKEGLCAPLPKEWNPCKTTDDDIYYFNFETGESRWEHPCDEYYKNLFQKENEKQIADPSYVSLPKEQLATNINVNSASHSRNNSQDAMNNTNTDVVNTNARRPPLHDKLPTLEKVKALEQAQRKESLYNDIEELVDNANNEFIKHASRSNSQTVSESTSDSSSLLLSQGKGNINVSTSPALVDDFPVAMVSLDAQINGTKTAAPTKKLMFNPRDNNENTMGSLRISKINTNDSVPHQVISLENPQHDSSNDTKSTVKQNNSPKISITSDANIAPIETTINNKHKSFSELEKNYAEHLQSLEIQQQDKLKQIKQEHEQQIRYRHTFTPSILEFKGDYNHIFA